MNNTQRQPNKRIGPKVAQASVLESNSVSAPGGGWHDQAPLGRGVFIKWPPP